MGASQRSLEAPFFRTLVEDAVDGILVFDGEGTIAFANQPVERLLGYGREELIDRKVEGLFSDEDRARIVDRIDHPSEGPDGESNTSKTRVSLVHEDGHEVDVTLSVRETDYEGEDFFTAFLREHPRHARAVPESREPVERYGGFSESGGEAVLVIDPEEEEIAACNRRAREMFGYSRGELVGRGIAVVCSDETDGRDAFGGFDLGEGEGTDRIECSTADGGTIPVEISVSEVQMDDRSHTVAIVRDFTERESVSGRAETLEETTRALMDAETIDAIVEIAIDAIDRLLGGTIEVVWEYDADADVLRPQRVVDDAGIIGESVDPGVAIGPIVAGSLEMSAFREDRIEVIEGYRTANHPAHPELPLETRVVVPLGEHGMVTVGSLDGDIAPLVRELITIIARNTRAAVDRLERENELERHRSAIEASIDGIFIIDEDEEFVYTNDALIEGYGFDDRETLVDDGWERLYEEGEIERFRSEILPEVRRCGRWRGETMGKRANGETFFQELSLAQLDDGGVVGVCRDITDRKRHKEQLESLNEFGRDLMQAESADEIAGIGTEAVERVLGFQTGCVRVLDTETNSLDPVAMTDRAAEMIAARPAFDLGVTYAGTAYRREEIVISDLSMVDAADAGPAPCSLHVPIGERGVLTVITEPDEEFDEIEIQLAKALSANIRVALDRAERERMLRNRREECVQQRQELDTLNRTHELISEIIRGFIGAITRDEIEQTVCRRLATSEFFESAWIGTTELGDDTIVPQHGVGVDESYLAALGQMSVSQIGDGVVATAIETGDVEVTRRYQVTPSASDTRDGDSDEGFEMIAAVPLTYADRTYGALVLNATREDVFSDNARAGFAALGQAIGFAINALRNQELLFSDAHTELEFRVTDPNVFLVALSDRFDCRCVLQETIPRDEGTFLHYVLVEGGPTDAVREAIEGADGIERCRPITEYESGCRFEIVTGESFAHVLLHNGANIQTMTAERGEGELVVEVARNEDIRAVIEAYQSSYPESELVRKVEVDRSDRSVGEFRDAVSERITERQLNVIEAACASGYYSWPRERTAEEIAESLGISSSTFHQHHRHAEREIVSEFLGETCGSASRSDADETADPPTGNP